MRTRKLLSGLGAAVMSLMMIIPWAVYADSPQTEDSSIVTESSAAEAMAEPGGHQGAEERHREHGDGLGTFRLYRWRCGGSAYNDRAYG